ncbi:MAG: hybrid sensor histidine kinase/response regulator [Bdellovibrionales bacterium]|nr:hybrid sensor histidine kinase/response regulator [Bdellovibrionales bacterium]
MANNFSKPMEPILSTPPDLISTKVRHNLLIVDDETHIVDALERLLRKKYNIFKATNGLEALNLLKVQPISLIISDQKMPQMSGVEFLSRSMETQPEALRILLTGYSDIESVIEAVNSGQIYKYITKPWDPYDLEISVDKAIERYELWHELANKNSQLTEALKELTSLDQAKNNFMMLVNHELKTPLTIIISYLQLLNDTQLDPDQARFLNRIISATERLQTLINDVLELITAETTLKVQKERISLTELFHSVKEKFHPALTKKNLTLSTQFTECLFMADRKVLQSILHRLLDNAIKFTQENSTIQFIGVQDQQKQLKFILKNPGKILSQDSIKKILKPFTLDENIMHHSTGTGLGLSICRALLKAHHSALHIESENDEFIVHFTI